MNKRFSIWILALLLLLGAQGLAQATYYHFEEYRDLDQVIAVNTTESWTFALEKEVFERWLIYAVPLQQNGTGWETVMQVDDGSMGTSDDLHEAYLSMRLCDFNGSCIEIIFDENLRAVSLNGQGGGTGALTVLSELYSDHILKVTISSGSQSFKVDWMKLTGCYESISVPVPEPGTLVLLGAGLVGLAVMMRKKG